MDNIIDIYIKGQDDPGYSELKLENNNILDVIISKIYMILLTSKGDVLGDKNFGADIPKLLWTTNFSNTVIENEIKNQIALYVNELNNTNYTLNVYILKGTSSDIGIIEFNIFKNSILFQFK